MTTLRVPLRGVRPTVVGMLLLSPLVAGMDQATASSVPLLVARHDISEVEGQLNGIDAISASDVWAVGYGVSTHWDGDTWQAARLPDDLRELSDVDGVSATDVWAVGRNGIAHWDGEQWTTDYSLPGSYLTGVSALDKDDVWVTGGQRAGSSYETVVLHWNGKSWKKTSLHIIDTGYSDISVISADDIWIIGGTFSGAHYIVHWNGHRWRSVSPADPQFAPASVRAVSSDDVWIVGTSGTRQAATEHWDGTKLAEIPCPHPQERSELSSVSAVSADDVWAVGESETYDSDPHRRGVTLHWDGSAWSKVKAPYAGPHSTSLRDVSAVAGDDAWTAGYHYAARKTHSYQVIGHWDGSAWTRVQ